MPTIMPQRPASKRATEVLACSVQETHTLDLSFGRSVARISLVLSRWVGEPYFRPVTRSGIRIQATNAGHRRQKGSVC